jgi:membrane-associated HD superfamily phosphohydrolase
MPGKKKLVLKKKKSYLSKKNKNIMKKMENITEEQSNQLKEYRINSLFYSLFIYIIIALVVCGIIKYLKELEQCQCFIEKTDKNNKDLKYLIFIEYVILTINIISILSCVYLLMTSNQKGGMDISTIKFFIMIYLTTYIIIFGYFVFSFYNLQDNIHKSCECSTSSLRYLLYIQVFLMAVGIYGAVLNLIRLFNIF